MMSALQLIQKLVSFVTILLSFLEPAGTYQPAVK